MRLGRVHIETPQPVVGPGFQNEHGDRLSQEPPDPPERTGRRLAAQPGIDHLIRQSGRIDLALQQRGICLVWIQAETGRETRPDDEHRALPHRRRIRATTERRALLRRTLRGGRGRFGVAGATGGGHRQVEHGRAREGMQAQPRMLRPRMSSPPSPHFHRLRSAPSAMLVARELTKEYRSGNLSSGALDSVSFEIPQGAYVAIVGASGSGKTTLLGLLAGLDTPTRGAVLIDGVDLGPLTEDGRAKLRGEKVGFVFQSFQLIPTLTALENVAVPLELRGDPDAASRGRDLLDRVGLASRASHFPAQLSGGEQQRVAIARAFANRPRVLFADEPTGNLDAATGARVIELLEALNRESGSTVVIVSHDTALAGRAERILRSRRWAHCGGHRSRAGRPSSQWSRLVSLGRWRALAALGVAGRSHHAAPPLAVHVIHRAGRGRPGRDRFVCRERRRIGARELSRLARG